MTPNIQYTLSAPRVQLLRLYLAKERQMFEKSL